MPLLIYPQVPCPIVTLHFVTINVLTFQSTVLTTESLTNNMTPIHITVITNSVIFNCLVSVRDHFNSTQVSPGSYIVNDNSKRWFLFLSNSDF